MPSTPSAKRAALNSGRGSRPGFSSSLRMSRTVGRPNFSSVNWSGLSPRRKPPSPISALIGLPVAPTDALHHRVGFRVHRRGVQRFLAIGDAQEAGALLEGLLAQPRHLEQILAALERAVVVAVAHDVLGHARRQPGHARQQRCRGGVDVHADCVHAVLHARVQRSRQAVLVDVVLVLAHADGLGLDLDQLRQRILQAPRDRHRTA